MLWSRSAIFDGEDPGVGGSNIRHDLAGGASLLSAEPIQRRVLCHHRRDRGAEVTLQRDQCVRGVLDRIVQHRRAQHLVVDLPGFLKPGEYRGDRYRMGDVWMTAEARLALMAPCRDIARMPEQLNVGAWPKRQDYLAEFPGQMAPGSVCT
jgi:hypothetical protein